MNLPELRVIGLPGIPIVTPGADLVALIHQATVSAPLPLQAGDILVITQKIVSKAEGCLVALKDVTPSPWAEQYARQWGKDPRHVEVVLHQSRRIVRMDRGVLISETHHGFVCANANLDNCEPEALDMPLVKERQIADLSTIMSNSFGFGGTNACLIFAHPRKLQI